MSAGVAPAQVQAGSERNLRRAILGIIYEERKPATYRGVTLTITEPGGTEIESQVFSTTNLPGDYERALNVCKDRGVDLVFCSSSVDGYLEDLRKLFGR